jgi:hypothetical protein
MLRKFTRRTFLAGTAAAAGAGTARFPAPAVALSDPFKLGLLTVKTGPLAPGGIQMEQGMLTFLKDALTGPALNAERVKDLSSIAVPTCPTLGLGVLRPLLRNRERVALRSIQSFQNPLNLSGASAVYRVVF